MQGLQGVFAAGSGVLHPASMERLLLVFGGRSAEHDISLRSAENVRAAVDRGRWEPVLLGVRRDGSWRTGPADAPLEHVLGAGDPVTDLRALRPAVVFPVLHGPYGEDGVFQGLCEALRLPYVGSGVLASALCMDKCAHKHLLASAAPDVPQVPWVQVDGRAPEAGLARARTQLSPPYFVKPANMGSSVGVARVTDPADLADAVGHAAGHDPKVLIEQGLDGPRELEVAILGDGGPDTVVSTPGEIVLPPDTWYDYETKYEKDVARTQVPADLDAAVAERLREVALRAFRASDAFGMARVDFLLDRDSQTPYLNEINTIPGFTSISMYPMLMAHAGVSAPRLISRLCELALARR